MSTKPHVSITYCTQCNWMLRAGWMAQELLSTFSLELGAVTLVPGTGGVFEITIDGATIWERKRDGGFPDIKVLKQRVRDVVDPDRDLGHIDRQTGGTPATDDQTGGTPATGNQTGGTPATGNQSEDPAG